MPIDAQTLRAQAINLLGLEPEQPGDVFDFSQESRIERFVAEIATANEMRRVYDCEAGIRAQRVIEIRNPHQGTARVFANVLVSDLIDEAFERAGNREGCPVDAESKSWPTLAWAIEQIAGDLNEYRMLTTRDEAQAYLAGRNWWWSHNGYGVKSGVESAMEEMGWSK
jgi:hypothetical protein